MYVPSGATLKEFSISSPFSKIPRILRVVVTTPTVP
jgi:hypothetical protein